MAYTLKNGRTPPTTTGEGELSYKGFKGQVAYEIIGALAGLRQGGASLRGSFMTTEEIADNAWLAAPADLDILFELPIEARWSAAAKRIGVDLSLISHATGHA